MALATALAPEVYPAGAPWGPVLSAQPSRGTWGHTAVWSPKPLPVTEGVRKCLRIPVTGPGLSVAGPVPDWPRHCAALGAGAGTSGRSWPLGACPHPALCLTAAQGKLGRKLVEIGVGEGSQRDWVRHDERG